MCWSGNETNNLGVSAWSTCSRTHVVLPVVVYVWFLPLQGIILLLVVFCNSLVIVSFVKFENIRTTPNYFLLSLSVADILIAPAVTMLIYVNIASDFRVTSRERVPCMVGLNVFLLSLTGSMFSLLGISIDRYIKIIHPLRYETIMSPWRAKTGLAVTWTVLVGVSMPVYYWNQFHTGMTCGADAIALQHNYVLIPLNLGAMVLISALYIRIFLAALRQRRAIADTESVARAAGAASNSTPAEEANLTKMAALIIGLLYLSWAPAICVELFFGECRSELRTGLELLTVTLLTCNSFMNPIIYQWRSPEIGAVIRKLLACQETSN
ncbi:Adenosine receptor A2a [Lamellibrachia satsuma]|nr:Adenosine receptor A2a [Lamellibrachia satsuma]